MINCVVIKLLMKILLEGMQLIKNIYDVCLESLGGTKWMSDTKTSDCLHINFSPQNNTLRRQHICQDMEA